MTIQFLMTDEQILSVMGHRIEAIRLQRNMTQAELAREAGVSKSTIERLEAGSVATRLTTLVRVLRVLRLVDRFDVLIPETKTSPMELLKLQGKTRKRASKRSDDTDEHTPWTWGV